MSSKNMEPKLTLQNLADHLQKWKRPYLREVKQTASEFHQKVEDHRKILIENNSQEIPQSFPNTQKQKILKIKSVEKEQKVNKKLKTQQLTQPQIIVLEPKLQEWKSDNEYRFKDLEQVIKNYDEVFKKKHKVKKNKKDQNIQDFRTDERYMIEQIYEELKNQKELTVSFEAIYQFFENYELFYYFYNIHPYRLISLLKQSAKKFQDKLTKHEFIDFFLIDRPTISEFKSSTEKNIYNKSILSQQIWKKLKNIFDTLDTFGNEKISIKTFFQRIKNNPSSISILSAEAIQFPDINRIYTLQKILFDLQNKMQFDTKVQWQIIQDLIRNFTHIQEPTIDIIFTKNIQKANISKQSNYFLLESKIIDMVKQIFNRCPKCCDCFVKASFFCVQLLEIGIMKPYLNTPTQLQNSTKNTYLSLEQVIRKMYKQAPKYIDMDEMLEFLSIKGYQNEKKFVQLYNKIQTDSSESEWETSEQKNERRLKKIRSYEQLKRQHKKDKKKLIHNRVTQVKQFKLHKKQQPTIRQKRVQEMIKQKQMEDQIQLKKKFKANPIPVTLNSERYERYTRILQKKKQSILNRLSMRREQDQNLIDYLKTNTKLFQLKKIKPYSPEPYQTYTFQPTPIPLHISEQLLPKIQAEKQERRRKKLEQNRKKYQQVYWKNIKEQPVNKDQSLLQEINLIEQRKKFQQIRAKQVPNFQQLHRKFEQQLESRKQIFSPTRIQEFKLSSPANRNRNSQYSSPQSFQFKSKSPPRTDIQVDIKSTKKYDDWVARNQTRIAQKQLQELKKQKEQEQRYLRQKNFAKLMRKNLSKCTDNTQLLKHKSQQKLKNFKNYVSKLQQQTEQQLAQIYVRVLQRPFLFQDAGATRKPKTKQRPKRVQAFKVSPEHQQQSHPYKQGLFEKQGDQFHPIESENLNQSF